MLSTKYCSTTNVKRGKVAGLLAVWIAGIVLAGCSGTSTSGSNAGSGAVASIAVTPTSASIFVGGTQSYTATAKNSSGTAVAGTTFTWTSKDTNVATIDSNGNALGVAAGTTQITASSGSITSPPVTLTVTTANSSESVSGTAAMGSPIAGATVTLKDATGNTSTATTSANGSFVVNTGGLTPPYFVEVQPSSGNPLYSVSADAKTATVINVHPFTDLVIRSWYGAQGKSIDTAFENPAAAPAPGPGAVQILANQITQMEQLWLGKAGVNLSNFNLISTPFSANGTGVDLVLNETTVNTATGTVTIKGGSTAQTSTLSYNTSANSLTVSTTTVSGTNKTSSVTTTVVPVQSAQQAALTSILNTMTGLQNAVNAAGNQLSSSDVVQYFAPNLLNDGLDQTDVVAGLVTDVRGATLTVNGVQNIVSMNTAAGTAEVVFSVGLTEGGVAQTQTLDQQFEDVSGTWLISGDNQIAKLSLQAEAETNQGAMTGDDGPQINVDTRALQGTVSGITISGGSIWSDTPLQAGSTLLQTYEPTPTTTLPLTFNQFFINSNTLTNLVPAGTPFTFTVTPVSGAADNYTVLSNAFTTEQVSITSPTGSSLADAMLGQPLTVDWTLPTTFAVSKIQLTSLAFTGSQSDPGTLECNVEAPSLPADATTGTITSPTTCGGLPVLEVNLNLSIYGVDGELAHVIYSFQ